MSALMRWIQKLCPCRRQANFEEQDDGQEKEGRWEQLQDAGGREKQYQMLLNLQRTMDPWIAAQVYNNNYSPLGRLPEELLLLILYYLDNEILSIYCLGRVSRTFRRLIYEPDIWKYAFPGEYPFSLEHIWTLPLDLRSQLQQRLQKDGMCDECKLWCDAPVEGLFRLFTQACNLDTNRNRGYCTIGCFCKFESAPCRSRLYCDACGNNHDVSAFSLSNQFSTKRDRRCLGRQGAVQLCEHIHVAWTTVETHIAIWQQRKPRDWQACFGHFVIECHDPSHDTRCTAEEAPTWPRARLRTAEHYPDLVVLNLEWKPHSGLDTFTVTPDGRVPASELRSLFQKYRQGPGGIQLPSYPSSPLPEMRDILVCHKKDRGKINPTHAWFHGFEIYGRMKREKGRHGQNPDQIGRWAGAPPR
ncbi:hypothetical protein AAE478_003014 [Parahypoxylon ruwenzoriense]